MTIEGKVYSIGLKGSSHSYALTELQSDQFHGVHCLKGTSRSPKNPAWFEGKQVYIPVVEIAAIFEYDSWDDYLTACKLGNGAAPGGAKAPPPAMKKIKKRAKVKKR